MNSLLDAIAEGIRLTAPFQDMPPTTRPVTTILNAAITTNLALRLPLYHQRLGKARPKPKAYQEAIQHGLAVLAAFAAAANVNQAIVRIADGEREAISFQPRPAGVNWTREHSISPASLWSNGSDPMFFPGIDLSPEASATEVSTRGMVHLAGKTALAILRHTDEDRLDGTVTFGFDNQFMRPRARAVFRYFGPNHPTHVLELGQP